MKLWHLLIIISCYIQVVLCGFNFERFRMVQNWNQRSWPSSTDCYMFVFLYPSINISSKIGVINDPWCNTSDMGTLQNSKGLHFSLDITAQPSPYRECFWHHEAARRELLILVLLRTMPLHMLLVTSFIKHWKYTTAPHVQINTIQCNDLDDNRKMLCFFKAFDQTKKHFGGFHVPTNCFFDYIIKLEDVFFKNFSTNTKSLTVGK